MELSEERLCGLLVVDKPLGVSSMAVVRKVRWAASKAAGRGKQKVGHAGTLDPLATGVVICLLGRATRWCDRLMAEAKVYEATVDLSAFTATDDREGEREEVAVAAAPLAEAVRAAAASFVGVIEQAPPAYSALHVNGRRAYKLARQGQPVELPTRPVRIDEIVVRNYAWPLVELTITCGKGTYIRSLARDIGLKLQTGGHLAALRRTAVGRYDLSMAVTFERLEARPVNQGDLMELSKGE